MIRLGNCHLELTVSVVAARPTAHKLIVVFRPVIPIIPKSSVPEYQALACRDKIKNRFPDSWISNGLVVDEVEYVRIGEVIVNRVRVVSISYHCQSSVPQGFGVGLLVPAIEIVRRSA